MRTRRLLIYFLLTVMSGCAAPGAPLIRESEGDGQGPLVDGCQNISFSDRTFKLPDEFITNSYLTTWSSAWKEGAFEGYRETAEKAKESGDNESLQALALIDLLVNNGVATTRLAKSQAASWPEPVNAFAKETVPFCKLFSANSSKIFGLVQALFDKLDYPIHFSDSQLGELETEFVERKHGAARWRDRYLIMTLEVESDKSVLVVHRAVFIDRSGEMFNEGMSVGHNESWIIKQVSKGLDEEAYQ